MRDAKFKSCTDEIKRVAKRFKGQTLTLDQSQEITALLEEFRINVIFPAYIEAVRKEINAK